MDYKQYTNHEISGLNKTQTWYQKPIEIKVIQVIKKIKMKNIFFMLQEMQT